MPKADDLVEPGMDAPPPEPETLPVPPVPPVPAAPEPIETRPDNSWQMPKADDLVEPSMDAPPPEPETPPEPEKPTRQSSPDHIRPPQLAGTSWSASDPIWNTFATGGMGEGGGAPEAPINMGGAQNGDTNTALQSLIQSADAIVPLLQECKNLLERIADAVDDGVTGTYGS